MANKYLDNLHPNAADTVLNGTEAAPYLTIAYALTQATSGDWMYVGNATAYTLAAANLNITKSIFFVNWNNRAGARPTINGGDATRVININTANPVVFDGFILEMTRNPVGSYISQSRAACRDVRFRNCHFQGSVGLGAVNGEGGSSGTIIESTCTYDMTAGGFVYTAATGAIESYASGTLRGAAQALFFISNGDSNGADFVLGGTHNLVTTNNYVLRCGTTNSDADITVDSTFYLQSVPSTYSRSTFDIIDPRSFTIEDGARIDTTDSENGALGDVWVRCPTGVAGAVYIRGLEIDRAAIVGYGVKIGDESPGASHTANSLTAVEIENVHIRDGGVFGTVGTTQTHMIFVGNEKKYKIKNCFIEGGAYGVGIKGDDTADPSSFVYNCKIVGVRLSSMKTKGIENTRWFNNYIIEDGAGGIGLDITDNTDSGATGIGAGAISRGNIFVMDTEVAINVDAASDLGNNDFDYDTFYLNGASIATFATSTYTTIAQLRAAKGVERQGYSMPAAAPALDADDLALIGTENYQSGAPLTGGTKIYDATGVTEVTLSGATLHFDSPYIRSRFHQT